MELKFFAKTLPCVCRIDVIRKVLHASADHHTGDHTPLGDDIEHGEFLSHALGVVVERQHIAQNDQFGLARAPGQTGRHNIGRRHIAVGILMVFVDAHAFKAAFIGLFELIELAIVQGMAEFGIVEGIGTRDPGTVMVLGKIVGEMGPGHEVKTIKLHV